MAFSQKGSFVPRYTVFDISNAGRSKDMKQLLVHLMLRMNDFADAINIRRSGAYEMEEFGNGEVFAPVQSGTNPAARPVHQQTYFAGPLANAGALSIAHGINWTATTTLVGLEAWATDTSNVYSIALPHVDVSSTPVTGDIEIYVDGTNIVITSAGDATSFNTVVVTLRWLQN